MFRFIKTILILVLSLFFLSSAQSLTITKVMRLLYPPVGLFDDEEKSSSRVFERRFIHDRPFTSVTQYHLPQTHVFFEIELPEDDLQVDAPDIQENLTLNINHQGQVLQIWSLADCLNLCNKKDLQSLTLEELKLCLENLLKSLKGSLPSENLIITAIQALISAINEQLTPSQVAPSVQTTASSTINFDGLFDDVQANATESTHHNGAGIDFDDASSIFGSSSTIVNSGNGGSLFK